MTRQRAASEPLPTSATTTASSISSIDVPAGVDPSVVHPPSRRTASRLPLPGQSSSLVSYDPDLAARQADEVQQIQNDETLLERARRVASTAIDRTVDAARSNPLTAGAAVVAAGVCVGLAIPSSRTEDELMGEASDDAIASARHGARELLRDGRTVARRAVNAAGRKIRREAPDASDIGSAVREVARAAEEAAEEEARRRGVTPTDLSSKADSLLDEVTTIGRAPDASRYSAAAIARDTPYTVPDDCVALPIEPFEEPPLNG